MEYLDGYLDNGILYLIWDGEISRSQVKIDTIYLQELENTVKGYVKFFLSGTENGAGIAPMFERIK